MMRLARSEPERFDYEGQNRGTSAGPPITAAELSELLGSIYAGPFETPAWRSALAALKRRLDASYAFFILRPPSPHERGMILASANEQHAETDYYDYGYAFDPFVNLPRNRVVTVDEVVGAKAWVEGEFYRRFLPPGGRMRFVLGADIETEEGVECRLRIGRSASGGDYTEAEKTLCRLLLPHLAASVRYHARLDSLESERSLFAAMVERLLVGTLIFDDRGRIVKMNRAAEAILAQKDGLEIVRETLRVTYLPEENGELQRRIQTAIAGTARKRASVMEAIAVTRPSGRQKFGILVRAIPCRERVGSSCRPTIAVFVRDPDQHAAGSPAMLNQLFRLTPTESALALHLTNGLTLEDSAITLKMRKNTARAHLRSIFSKVGVGSQAALVRALLNSVLQLE